MNRVIHFEIPVSDPERSIHFFKELFGWKFTRFGDLEYWSVETGDGNDAGINGGLMKRNHPEQPIVNTIEVTDIDAMTSRIEKAGGTIVVPKMPIPGVGWLVYFKDPDGNIHGITQIDPEAK